MPPDKVDVVVPLVASECFCCHGPVEERADAEVHRHQVIEMPPVKPHVTEYQQRARWCGGCSAWTWPTLPDDTPRGAFGPRLMALIALLSGRYRLSKREVMDLLANMLGVELSVGSVSNVENKVSEALAQPVAAAREYVRNQHAAHLDETGWRERLRRAWLWVAVTAEVTVFLVDKHRSAAVAKALLGDDFAGRTVTDRYSAYTWVDPARRQVCWSHLRRDFQGFVDRGGVGGLVGARLLEQSGLMFQWWHRVRDGTLHRATFQSRMKRVREEVGQLLRSAAVCPDAKTAGVATEVLKLEDALWTFVDVPGIAPTNNVAERALRPAVLWRKGSFGTHSERGSRFAERMLTVIATLRQQNRNVLEFLTEAMTASTQSQSPPTLLPSNTRVA